MRKERKVGTERPQGLELPWLEKSTLQSLGGCGEAVGGVNFYITILILGRKCVTSPAIRGFCVLL